MNAPRPAFVARTQKSEATRQRILDMALALFREKGFEQATMRDVARAAGMSLGAAYYYFDSKEALVLDFFERLASAHERAVAEALAGKRDLGERLRVVCHTHLDVAAPDRKLLGALVHTLGDPESSVSVFAKQTEAIRRRSRALFEQALSVDAVPAELRGEFSLGLWIFQLSVLLYFIHDDSPGQTRTRALVDDVIGLLAPLAPLLGSAQVEPLRAQIRSILGRARLLPAGSTGEHAHGKSAP